jgi:hypothetical protein
MKNTTYYMDYEKALHYAKASDPNQQLINAINNVKQTREDPKQDEINKHLSELSSKLLQQSKNSFGEHLSKFRTGELLKHLIDSKKPIFVTPNNPLTHLSESGTRSKKRDISLADAALKYPHTLLSQEHRHNFGNYSPHYDVENGLLKIHLPLHTPDSLLEFVNEAHKAHHESLNDLNENGEYASYKNPPKSSTLEKSTNSYHPVHSVRQGSQYHFHTDEPRFFTDERHKELMDNADIPYHTTLSIPMTMEELEAHGKHNNTLRLLHKNAARSLEAGREPEMFISSPQDNHVPRQGHTANLMTVSPFMEENNSYNKETEDLRFPKVVYPDHYKPY